MSNNNVRDNFKDIFGVSFFVSLSFEGKYDMPIVGNFDDITNIDYIALYSDVSEYNKTENTCVAFYQYDHIFDGINGLYNAIIYKNERRLNYFRERFKNVKYIIAPDYSLFADFPVPLQMMNVFKSRVCCCWIVVNTKAKAIPNSRWTLPFSYEFCFDGIMKGSNIAIGLLGQIRNKENKKMFLDGFKEAVDRIKPKCILVYGFVTNENLYELFGYAISKGIKIVIPHSKIDRYKKGNAIYGTR